MESRNIFLLLEEIFLDHFMIWRVEWRSEEIFYQVKFSLILNQRLEISYDTILNIPINRTKRQIYRSIGMREEEEKRNSKAQQRRYFDLFNSRRNCANNEYRIRVGCIRCTRTLSKWFVRVSEMLNTTRCLFIGAYWIDIWPLTQLGAREGGGEETSGQRVRCRWLESNVVSKDDEGDAWKIERGGEVQ